MSEKRTIVRRSLGEAKAGKTDWAALDALSDDDIQKAAASDPDAAPIADDDWFKNARLIEPPPKAAISIRIDQDVLEWFKANGGRYQTRINAVLRAYMEHARGGKR